uniref:Uncharacterized protein n=1 Tax=Meloidogyne enterolobii TaxID=390850 RepID=A0A6V7TJS3_MELEN|nr:unnamed protein product [Meloidogyne enterolobii]CAD2123565.1 unnamed protein product [Meloidogyne enterolobii]
MFIKINRIGGRRKFSRNDALGLFFINRSCNARDEISLMLRKYKNLNNTIEIKIYCLTKEIKN